jgi:hypothetical protein
MNLIEPHRSDPPGPSSPHLPDAPDNLPTVVAIALVAYVAADIAHHALGHGLMCWLQGGQIELLSSVFVRCSRTGLAIDLAGPGANLILGLIAALVLRVTRRMSVSTELFFILLAGFNLMWFSIHLVFSVVTDSDDWAWLLHVFNGTPTAGYFLGGAGVLVYMLAVRELRTRMARFARPQGRARLIVIAAWLSAGAIACATAVFDPHGPGTVWHKALPQSMLLSIGLLSLPGRARQLAPPPEGCPAIGISWGWIAAAAVLSVLSIVFLGPGVGLKRPW